MKILRTALIALTGALLFIAGHITTAAPAHGQGQQLVYVCQQTPCANGQELEVFDANGSPIYSVGEFGGDAVFGDNRSVFPPGSVFNPSVVESYESPAKYDADHGLPATCVPPELWIGPLGIYHCQANGTWPASPR